ncbi:MAG: ABC transporter permease, partial [Actinomadura sp.]
MSWRQNGLLRRLSLSPVGVPAVVGARVLVSLGIALVQTVVFVGVAAGLFGLRLADSWWLAIPLVLAGTLAFLSIGLLAGAMVKTV